MRVICDGTDLLWGIKIRWTAGMTIENKTFRDDRDFVLKLEHQCFLRTKYFSDLYTVYFVVMLYNQIKRYSCIQNTV